MSRAVSMSALLAIVFSTAAMAEEPSKNATATVDPTKGGAIATAVCSACHGPDGNATGPGFPKLASQNPVYLAKQLHNFKLQGDAKVPQRNNAIMAGYAAALSDTDIKNVSAFYATQVWKPANAKSKDTVALGEKIWRGGIVEKAVPACAGCHSPNGAGIPVQYPRLAGQWGEYNEAQLTAFKTGTRKNSAPMTAIASRLSEAEIKAVSDYAAGLR
jgi:cbb3-type cytochrome c oxidase subunit III